jgi:hypothetical protein
MDIEELIGTQLWFSVPRSCPGLLHPSAIGEPASIKVSVGKGGDGGMHTILHGEEGDGGRADLHDALEKTLFIGVDTSSLGDDGGRELIRIYAEKWEIKKDQLSVPPTRMQCLQPYWRGIRAETSTA